MNQRMSKPARGGMERSLLRHFDMFGSRNRAVRWSGLEETWKGSLGDPVDGNAGTRTAASLRHTPMVLSKMVKSVAPSRRVFIGFWTSGTARGSLV